MINARQLDVSSHPSFDSHEQVVHFEDAELGLIGNYRCSQYEFGPIARWIAVFIHMHHSMMH